MERIGAKLTTLCRRDTNLDAAKILLTTVPQEQWTLVVNSKDRGGSTPLMAAVWDGAKSISEWLVECGANVNEQNLKGNTALHFAYECSDMELVEYLVSKGGDEDRRNYKNKKPVDLLDKRKNDIERALDAEKDLLQQAMPVVVEGEKVKHSKVTPGVVNSDLLRACKDGDLKLAIKICEGEARKAGMSVEKYVNLQDANGSTGLMSAAWDGRLSVVALYVEVGANVRAVNRKRNTAMHFALEQGHYDVATYLKIHGGDECLRWRNRLGFTPLDLKTQFEKKDHSRFSTPKLAAVERAKSVRQDLQITLLRACRRGDMGLIKDVIASWKKEMHHAGMGVIDVLDFPDKNLSTPLISAVFHNQLEVVKFLVKEGVSLSAANCSGNTSLHIAYAKGSTEIVEFLLKSGADASMLNDKGETPEQALLTALAEKQAKLMKDMEAQALKDSFDAALLDDPSQVTLSSSQSSLQPRRPSGSKPDVTRPAPHTSDNATTTTDGTEAGEDAATELPCSPVRKLDFAQRLDAQLGKRHTMSRLVTSQKPAPSEAVRATLEHVENIFARDGMKWEVFETPNTDIDAHVVYHNPDLDKWLYEVDVWKACKSPPDSYGSTVPYWQNLITGECSWKVPRVLFPKAALTPIIVKKIVRMSSSASADSSSEKKEGGANAVEAETAEASAEYQNYTAEDDEELVKQREEKEEEEIGREVEGKKSLLSQSVFHALSLGMGLRDVIDQLIVDRPKRMESAPAVTLETDAGAADDDAAASVVVADAAIA